ncbi:unnamed protein product [Amoebophrya sp. A120]|nr:unnamed protein product [Amoebophrya sp. A120]|eukprot:GSA120T00006467001.1
MGNFDVPHPMTLSPVNFGHYSLYTIRFQDALIDHQVGANNAHTNTVKKELRERGFHVRFEIFLADGTTKITETLPAEPFQRRSLKGAHNRYFFRWNYLFQSFGVQHAPNNAGTTQLANADGGGSSSTAGAQGTASASGTNAGGNNPTRGGGQQEDDRNHIKGTFLTQSLSRNDAENRKNNYAMNLIQLLYEFEHGQINTSGFLSAFHALEAHFRPVGSGSDAHQGAGGSLRRLRGDRNPGPPPLRRGMPNGMGMFEDRGDSGHNSGPAVEPLPSTFNYFQEFIFKYNPDTGAAQAGGHNNFDMLVDTPGDHPNFGSALGRFGGGHQESSSSGTMKLPFSDKDPPGVQDESLSWFLRERQFPNLRVDQREAPQRAMLLASMMGYFMTQRSNRARDERQQHHLLDQDPASIGGGTSMRGGPLGSMSGVKGLFTGGGQTVGGSQSSGKSKPIEYEPRFPEKWIRWLLQTLPQTASQLIMRQEFTKEELHDHMRAYYGAKWQQQAVKGLSDITKANYRDMADFDFLRILPLLRSFGISPSPIALSAFPTAQMRTKAEASFIKRCTAAVKQIEVDYGANGDIARFEQLYLQQEGQERRREVECNDLLPRYFQSVGHFGCFIEYCPSLQILVSYIVTRLPPRLLCLVDETTTDRVVRLFFETENQAGIVQQHPAAAAGTNQVLVVDQELCRFFQQKLNTNSTPPLPDRQCLILPSYLSLPYVDHTGGGGASNGQNSRAISDYCAERITWSRNQATAGGAAGALDILPGAGGRAGAGLAVAGRGGGGATALLGGSGPNVSQFDPHNYVANLNSRHAGGGMVRGYGTMHTSGQMTPLMAVVLHFLESFDIREADMQFLRAICKLFDYSSACVHAILRNSTSVYSLNYNSILQLLSLPTNVEDSRRCGSALLQWIREKYHMQHSSRADHASRLLVVPGTAAVQQQVDDDMGVLVDAQMNSNTLALEARMSGFEQTMQQTFIAFSHFVSCQKIRKWHNKLLEEVSHFWFFNQVDSYKLVMGVLNIEDKFSWEVARLENPHEQLVVADVTQKILMSTRRVITDAYDEDPTLLRIILQKPTNFRFELLNLILDHRIGHNTNHLMQNMVGGTSARGGGVEAGTSYNLGFQQQQGHLLQMDMEDDQMTGVESGSAVVLQQQQLQSMQQSSSTRQDLLSPVLKEATLIQTIVTTYNPPGGPRPSRNQTAEQHEKQVKRYRASNLGTKVQMIQERLQRFLNRIFSANIQLLELHDMLKHKVKGFYTLIALFNLKLSCNGASPGDEANKQKEFLQQLDREILLKLEKTGTGSAALTSKQLYSVAQTREPRLDPFTFEVVEARERQLRQFDAELEQFSIYVKMYCKSANIECSELNQKVETLHKIYNFKSLVSAEPEFLYEPVLRHVKKLYDLRNSELFLDIWRRIGLHLQEFGNLQLFRSNMLRGTSSNTFVGGSSSQQGALTNNSAATTSGATAGGAEGAGGTSKAQTEAEQKKLTAQLSTLNISFTAVEQWIDGIPKPPPDSKQLQRQNSMHKELSVAEEVGIEFQALDDQVPVYGLCRELPKGPANGTTTSDDAATSKRPYTMSLWEVTPSVGSSSSGEATSSTLVAQCTCNGAKIKMPSNYGSEEIEYITGKFQQPVLLKKRWQYRISVQVQSSNGSAASGNSALQNDFYWGSYSRTTGKDNSLSVATSQTGATASTERLTPQMLGRFNGVIWGHKKGEFPSQKAAKSRCAPSIGVLVDKYILATRAEQVGSPSEAASKNNKSVGLTSTMSPPNTGAINAGGAGGSSSSASALLAGAASGAMAVVSAAGGGGLDQSGSDARQKKMKKLVEIEQSLAVTDIIPTAFYQWDDLAENLIFGHQDLETGFKLFGVLGNRTGRPTLSTAALQKEVRLLQAMTDIIPKYKGLDQLKQQKHYSRRKNVNDLYVESGSGAGGRCNWADVALQDIAELRFLERLSVWIPGILKFYHTSKPYLFPEASADDPYIKNLEQCAQVVQNAKATWVLGSVREEVVPFKRYLDAISHDHQDFLTTFANRREVLLWLFCHTDLTSFDKKIRLVRPCTDDEVLLRALSQLSELRRTVSDLFYKGHHVDAATDVMADMASVSEQQPQSTDVGAAGAAAIIGTTAQDKDQEDDDAAKAKAAALLKIAEHAKNCRHFESLEAFLNCYTSKENGLQFTYNAQNKSAFASMAQVATKNQTLMNQFYQQPLGLQQQNIKASGGGSNTEFRESEQLSCLCVVTVSWDRLHDLLERNTLSPGIKACRDVKPILLKGQFVFHGTADTNYQLVCRRTLEIAGGMIENVDEMKFEQLAEMRRLLLMTDPQEDEEQNKPSATAGADTDAEMDEEMPDVLLEKVLELERNAKGLVLEPGQTSTVSGTNADGFTAEHQRVYRAYAEKRVKQMKLKEVVDDFVDKLEVLEDIRHLVADLYSNGHFDYAHGEVLRISPLESTAALRRKKEELQQVLSEWTTSMRDIRGQYYCLNFFVVKHLQSLRDDIRLIESSLWERGCLPLKPQYSDQELRADFVHLLSQPGSDGTPATQQPVHLQRASAQLALPAAAAGTATPKNAATAGGGEAKPPPSGTSAGAAASTGERPSATTAAEAVLLYPGTFLQTLDRMLDVRQYISGERLLPSGVSVTAVTLKETPWDSEDLVSLFKFGRQLLQTFHSFGRFPRTSATEQIHYIGKLLDSMFGSITYREKKITWISNRAATHFSKQKLQQGDLLIQEINAQERGGGVSSGTMSKDDLLCAEVPGGSSAGRPRRVSESKKPEQQNTVVPIFACTTPKEEDVVGLVLSLYFRRERLPEPQEVLLCTETTQVEEIEILIRRFIQARLHKREKCVFCIGNIQLLSYQIQCRAVELLGVLLSEYGVANAAALVLVSGSPNQMLLNAATSQCGVQYINVSKLSPNELQLCLKHAVPSVSAAFGRDINGCGKTDFIYREAFQIQHHAKDDKLSVYRKLAIRENTDKREVINAAKSIQTRQKLEERDDRDFVRRNFHRHKRRPQWTPPSGSGARIAGAAASSSKEAAGATGGAVSASEQAAGIKSEAEQVGAKENDDDASMQDVAASAAMKNLDYDHLIHVDLAHVVQKRTNIVLFELLCLGCIIDPLSSQIFFRSPRDRYVVEIPATPGNQLMNHLSVLPLLKKEHLTVDLAALQLDQPRFLQPNEDREGKSETKLDPSTRTHFLQLAPNYDILITCKFLRALDGERFLKKKEEDPNAHDDKELLRERISTEECWRLLERFCCQERTRTKPDGTTEPQREHPSFFTFNLFARFMRKQFDRTRQFALLTMNLSRAMGLNSLRHYFCSMLVKTSGDFSLRQVPKYLTMDEMRADADDEAVLAELSPKRAFSSSVAMDSTQAAPPALELAAAPSSGTGPASMDVDSDAAKQDGAKHSDHEPANPANPADLQSVNASSALVAKRSVSRSSAVPRASQQQQGGGGRHSMVDMRSRQEMTEHEALTSELGRDRLGVGKVSATNMVERFEGMMNWEGKDHPVSVFKLNKGKVSGIDIVSLNEKTVEQNLKMDRTFTRSLDNNGLRVFKDWSQASADECGKLIRAAKGIPDFAGSGTSPAGTNAGGNGTAQNKAALSDLQKIVKNYAQQKGGLSHRTLGHTQYVLTIDNLLKILSILLRMEYGLPAIIMGETGCGKTALVEFICDMLRFPLRKLDLHGGITDEEITKFFQSCIQSAKALPQDQYLVAFLDEINAANCMAHCKTLIVDRFVENERLPPNIRIVACCNPYRLRKNIESEQMGLVYQHHFADGGIVSKTDHMKKLVYRVHQLPESLIDLVTDFGALTDRTEALYIDAILRRELPLVLTRELEAKLPDMENDARRETAIGKVVFRYENFLTTFATLLRKSQEYIRQISNNERSVVSLRDIARASRVFRWFLRHCTKLQEHPATTPTPGAGGPGSSSSASGGSATSAAGSANNNAASSSSGAGASQPASAAATAQAHEPSLVFGISSPALQQQQVEAEVLARQAEAERDVEMGGTTGGNKSPTASNNKNRPVSDPEDGPIYTSLTGSNSALATAVLLTLGFCYHSRLAREDREGYHRHLWNATKAEENSAAKEGEMFPDQTRLPHLGMTWLKLTKETTFLQVLEKTQKQFVSLMKLGEGIALNEALRENLFMLLVSVMNQIPIFVIGKPGCSKSLAVSILQDNLKGSVSDQPLFKQMPAIEVLPYQCSPLSTADGIQNAFDNARKYQGGGEGKLKTIVVVLLDEVGLAEESPHLPLKVLHKELERPGKGITCIGISNWSLDAAKMSRAVHLYRSPPTIEDLTLTAEGMIQTAQLRMYLKSLAEAFHAIYQNQPRQDFWGLREFYSTVRVVNGELKQREKRGEPQSLDADCLMKTVLRNFGGCVQQDMERNIENFFRKVGMRAEDGKRYSVVELIQQNLEESDARHLMLLTKNNSALRLLFDSGVISYEQETEILFGSSFPDDQSDVMVATNLNRIRSVMTKPIQLVLIHCDALYESLYDLLNQHYMEFGGQRYVRIAHGSSSKQCPIHHQFRVIVIVEKADAWTRLAPPLLNRFEKQIFLRSQLLVAKEDRVLLDRLNEWLTLLAKDVLTQQQSGVAEKNKQKLKLENDEEKLRAVKKRCIPGFHSDILPSLVVSLRRYNVTGLDTTGLSPTPQLAQVDQQLDRLDDVEQISVVSDNKKFDASSSNLTLAEKLGRALHDLTWVLTPEAVTAHMAAVQAGTSACFSKFNPKTHPSYPNVGEEYFRSQQHGDLKQFVEGIEQAYADHDGRGAQPFFRAGGGGDEDTNGQDVDMVIMDEQGDAIMEDVSVKAQDGHDSASSAASTRNLTTLDGGSEIAAALGGAGASSRAAGGFKNNVLFEMAAQQPLGTQIMCMTYTPMIGGSVLADVIRTEGRPVHHFLLHTLSSASELDQKVKDFYQSSSSSDSAGQLPRAAGELQSSSGAEDHQDNPAAAGQKKPMKQDSGDRKVKEFLLGQEETATASATTTTSHRQEHHYLLIEADPIASSDRQIEHCRCICEKAEHLYRLRCAEERKQALLASSQLVNAEGNAAAGDINQSGGSLLRSGAGERPPKKHILLVIHLSMGRSSGLGSSNFLLDFDRRWRAVFIDSVNLAERSGLPDLTQMLNRNLRDVFQLVDFQYVLTNQCLRPSLARLIYPSRRAASALTQQITMLLFLCQSGDFVSLVKNLIDLVLEKFQAEEDKEHNKKVQAEQQRILKQTGNQSVMSPRLEDSKLAEESYSLALQNVVRKAWYADDTSATSSTFKSGTFCGSLHNRLLRILQSLIAKMLAFLDRNHGLSLFKKYPSVSLDLADHVMQDANCKLTLDLLRSLTIRGNNANETVNNFEEVLNDSRSERAPFYAMFPFSYFVVQSLDQRRVLVQNRLESSTVATDPRKLAEAIQTNYSLPLEPFFAKPNCRISNLRYLHDLVAMSVPHTNSLSRWSQTLLLLALIRKTFNVRNAELEEAQEAIIKNEESVTQDTDLPILSFPASLFEVQVGYWLNEKRMVFLSQILSCCPAAIAPVLNCIQQEVEWDQREQQAMIAAFGSAGSATAQASLPYTQNQKLLGFNALLASIVIDHLVAELRQMAAFREDEQSSTTATFKTFTEWTERAQGLLQHIQDLLQDSYLFQASKVDASNRVSTSNGAVNEGEALQQVYILLQNRISFFRNIKVLKLDLLCQLVKKLALDCHISHLVDLSPVFAFTKTRDPFDKSENSAETPAEASKLHFKNSFRDIRTVEQILINFHDVLKKNAEYVCTTNFYALERGGGGIDLTTATAFRKQGSKTLFDPPNRGGGPGGRGNSAHVTLSMQMRKKLGEVLEWLYLDGWLLSEQENDYLLSHLPTDLLKHLCCHASGRPCCIRHNTLVAHETHDADSIALLPGVVASAGSSSGSGAGASSSSSSHQPQGILGMDAVPCSTTFTLALLRKLRRLGSPIIEQEIRNMLQRAQEKNKEQCRDTQFAWSVAIVEEEMARDRLAALLEKHEGSGSSSTNSHRASSVKSNSSPPSGAVDGGNSASPPVIQIERPLKRLKLAVPDEEELDLMTAYIELGRLYKEAEENPKKLLEKLRGVAKFRAYLFHYMANTRAEYLRLEQFGPGPEAAMQQRTISGLSVQSFSGDSASPVNVNGGVVGTRIAKVCENELLDQDEKSILPSSKTREPTFFIRSARMLALKQWERVGGSSELQRAMAEAPLLNVPWFDKWRNDGQAQDLTGYMGGSKLPKWLPYQDFNREQEYQNAETVISGFAVHLDQSTLEEHLRNVTRFPQDTQRRLVGALALRLSRCGQERAVTKPTNYEEKLAQWARMSQSFNTNSPLSAAFPPGYLNILLYFLGDETLRNLYQQKQLANEQIISQWDYFYLSTSSTTEQIAQFRFLPHFLSVVWSAPKNSVLYFFRELMENPKPYAEKDEECWLPGMEIDIREVCTSAMKDHKLSNMSRFCLCPNGHPYYIGDCGQAYTQAKCPECGEDVGGSAHNLLATNKRMSNDDESAPGYTHNVSFDAYEEQNSRKPKGSNKDYYSARRSLTTPSYVCVTRLLTHAAMWCGLVMRSNQVLEGVMQTGGAAQQSTAASSSSSGQQTGTFYAKIVNNEYVRPELVRNEMKWVRHQLVLDWRLLCEFLSSNGEEVAKFLHILIDRMYRQPERANMGSANHANSEVETQEWRIGIEEARRNELSEVWQLPYSRDKRKQWETCFVGAYLEELVPTSGLRKVELTQADQRWQNVDGPFLVELRENYDISSYPLKKRHQEETLLWSYRSDPTLEVLQQRTTEARNPILSHLFKIYTQFACLEHLSDVLNFQRYVTSFYSHRKTKQEAQKMTVADMFEEVRRGHFANNNAVNHVINRTDSSSSSSSSSAGAGAVPGAGQHLHQAAGAGTTVTSSAAAGATSSGSPATSSSALLLENLERAFQGFASAWNAGFGSWIKRWECLDVPEVYLNTKMSLDTKLIFCLASETDEGICSLALVQSMCEAHNAFLDRIREQEKDLVRQNYKINRRKEQQMNGRNSAGTNKPSYVDEEDALDEEENINSLLQEIDAKEISTRDVVQRSDCLSFHLEELLAWVKDRACKFVEGGSIDFDMDKIEQFLVETFQSKRKVNLELKLVRFTFQDANKFRSNLTALKARVASLKSVSSLKPLSPEDTTLLRDHFGNNPQFAEAFQRNLDLVANLLLKTLDVSSSSSGAGGNNKPGTPRTAQQEEKPQASINSQLYLEYCQTVLMLDESQIQEACGLAAMPVVRRLKVLQIVDVLEILENLASDLFDKVPIQFKTPLPEELKAVLDEMKPNVDVPVLLNALKTYIVEKMQFETKAGNDLKTYLMYVELGNEEDETLEDKPWFDMYFPASLEHRHVVAIHNYLDDEIDKVAGEDDRDDEDDADVLVPSKKSGEGASKIGEDVEMGGVTPNAQPKTGGKETLLPPA